MIQVQAGEGLYSSVHAGAFLTLVIDFKHCEHELLVRFSSMGGSHQAARYLIFVMYVGTGRLM